MSGRDYLTGLSFALLPLTAWITEIYDGGFWDAVYDYQTLITGVLAVLAAGGGGAAIVWATLRTFRENRNTELRQRKARARGIANLVGAELIRRANEAQLLNDLCVRALTKDPQEDAKFIFRNIFREEAVLGLNDELVHLAELAPVAAARVLEGLSQFRTLEAAISDHTKGVQCSLPLEGPTDWQDWSDIIQRDLREIAKNLLSLPQLDD